MQFSTSIIVALASMTSSVLADLHGNAICVNTVNNNQVYNDAATHEACRRYKHRNTGSNWWDTCPDCEFITTGVRHCQSNGRHLGGDEITYYCKLLGASNALTS